VSQCDESIASISMGELVVMLVAVNQLINTLISYANSDLNMQL
jgi:hypothetical protein